MYLFYYCLIYFIVFFTSVSASELNLEEEPDPDDKCAPYCIKVFLWSTMSTNQKLADCDKRKSQMATLERQLAVSKQKEEMYKREVWEKDIQCKLEREHHSDVLEMKNQLENLTLQAQNENKLVAEILKQLEDSRRTIEMKNERIKALEFTLEINNYVLESCKKNFSLEPAALMIMDTHREVKAKVYESSCINIGNSSDIWEIKVRGIDPFEVLCDGTVAGPGWTVIQRRVDKSVDFNRNWTDYRKGFGDLEGSFFIGLEKLHRMTDSRPHELYIHLRNFNNTAAYARYTHFWVGGNESSYKLNSLGEYSGDAGDSLRATVGMKFTTFDQDNDHHKHINCAADRHGGWWYNQCAGANLNGRFMENEWDKWDGIWWSKWQQTITLKAVQMLIRPTESEKSEKQKSHKL